MTRRTIRPRLLALEDRLAPAVATWDGGGADNKWSTAANWAGEVAPNPGDDLVFPAGAARLTNTNDFVAGTAFNSLAFTGLDYRISGSAITLGGAGVTVDAPRGSTGLDNPLISFDLTLGNLQTWTISPDSGLSVSGTLTLNGHALTASIGQGTGGAGLLLAGPVAGNGGLVKVGAGVVNLAGANTYTGTTDIQAGFVIATGSAALGDSSEVATVEAGAMLALQPSDPMYPIVELTQHIIFAGALGNMAHLIIGPESRFAGQITLAGPTEFALGGLEIIHGIDESGGSQSLTIGNNEPGFTDVGFDLGSASTYTGTTTVLGNGFVGFNGSGPPGPVVGMATLPPILSSSGAISGGGTIGPLTVGPDVTVSPGYGGHGPLTTGDVVISPPGSGRAGGTLAINLFEGGASTGLNVHGTVHIDGQLTTDVIFPLPPAIGTRWRIITNDGADPIQGIFQALPEGAVATSANGLDLRITYHGGDGNDVELFADKKGPAYSVGAGAGGAPQVNVYTEDGTLIRSFLAYDSAFRGGVHVATADVTGDGVKDVITAPGQGGGPVVRIWDGVTGAMVRQFNAYDPNFRGGVFVAGAHINSDASADIITGAGPSGGPHVRVFDGATNAVISEWLAYDANFFGGVSVAAFDGSDASGTFVPGTVITGAGPGGGPHVRTFNGVSGTAGSSFFAYDPTFHGGVFVSAGTFPVTIPGSTIGIVTSSGAGAASVVHIYDTSGVLRSSFPAYDPVFQGGATVSALSTTSGLHEIVTGAGPGGAPHVKVFNYGSLATSFFAFDPAFTGGIYVG